MLPGHQGESRVNPQDPAVRHPQELHRYFLFCSETSTEGTVPVTGVGVQPEAGQAYNLPEKRENSPVPLQKISL